MGRDKAFLSLVSEGAALIEIVLERLHAVADDVMIVANDRELYGSLDARVVPDLELGLGTLAGIHAAIRGARNDHCLVVACDMPFLNQDLLQAMCSHPRDYDVLVPRLPGESRQGAGGFVFQTLHAIYGKGCVPAIERWIAGGNRQVIGFFGDVRVETMELDDVRKHDPELRSFFNANTPEALAAATDLARSMEPFAQP
jgi:molybdopterin-guanine dinucleotide biosynthesis protein A